MDFTLVWSCRPPAIRVGTGLCVPGAHSAAQNCMMMFVFYLCALLFSTPHPPRPPSTLPLAGDVAFVGFPCVSHRYAVALPPCGVGDVPVGVRRLNSAGS